MSDNESQESLDYLQKGFDPSSLTVPRLRSILVSHNIPYPSGAKKPQLIEIFTDEVLPQSRKILSARSRARRTSKGITNADRDEVDEELMPPPPTPRPRSTRKASAKMKVEDSESETPSRLRSRSPVKRTPRASSGKHPRASGEENSSELDGLRRTVRKTRKSEAPIVKAEDLDEDFPRQTADDSAFSRENPFQSGSSPLASSRSPSGEGRRKTLHETPAKRRSSTARRRTADVAQSKANEGITPPTRSTFEIPISQLNGLRDYDENGVEASEDFTPEEQMELVRERSEGAAIVPRRPKKKAAKGFSVKGPFWVVALTMLGGYAAWYRQEKLAVGYCGVGRPAAPVISSKIDQLPDWAVGLAEPQCEPCPQHAYCYENLETVCEPDFVLKPHPLSLGGLVPLPPTCEPDGEKVRRIKVVADRAVEELRERRAKWECGDLVEEDGKPAKSVEIEEEELKKKVGEKRRRGMGEAEFEELWVGAIGEIKGREEVEVVNPDETNPRHTRLSSTSLAKVPIICAIRRSFRLAVARHRLQLGILTLLAALLLYIRHKYTSHLAINAAIPHLVSLTLDRLATQATRHATDPASFPESYIPISQLRDDVLRDEHSLSKRDRVWQKVRAVVEMNANVRAAQRMDRSGEIARVWEWIGAVGLVDEATPAASARRKSGRVSWGRFGEASSPVSGADEGPEIVQQKWQEGRPIY